MVIDHLLSRPFFDPPSSGWRLPFRIFGFESTEASSSFILLVVVLGQVSGPRCEIGWVDWLGWLGWFGSQTKTFFEEKKESTLEVLVDEINKSLLKTMVFSKILFPYAPIPSASGFGVCFGYLNTFKTRVFGALGIMVFGPPGVGLVWFDLVEDVQMFRYWEKNTHVFEGGT